MHINYRYVLEQARQFAEARPTARILDYGCGAGEVVRVGRERGLEYYGAETFHGGARQRDAMAATGMLGNEIKEIRDGKMEFADGFFDLIVSNQVLEHVQDFDAVMREFERVLKPGGRMLHIFPTGNVLREPHIGLPLVHWFPKGSRVRYGYALILRTLGVGFDKGDLSASEWTREKLQYVDERTFYRSMGVLRKRLEKSFEIQHIEDDYIDFRLRSNRRLSRLRALMGLPLVKPFGCFVFRQLAGVVLSCERKN